MIEINPATRDYCGTLIRESSTFLNSISERPDAAMGYHPQADALYWLDEYAEEFPDSLKRLYIVVLQLRTRRILNSIDPIGEEILRLSKCFAPNWAFNAPSRFASSFSMEFMRLRQLFSTQSDDSMMKVFGEHDG